MPCPECGADIPHDATECLECGAILRERPAPISTKATWSLALGLLSFLLPCLSGVPAAIAGLLALGDIRRSRGTMKGRGRAWAGILLGVATSMAAVGTVFVVAAMDFQNSAERGMLARTRGNMHVMAAAIDAYHTDHGAFPNTLDVLTAPIPAADWFAWDPFNHEGGEVEYAHERDYFVLRSYGIDRQPDADLAALLEAASAAGGWSEVDTSSLWDATNGLRSQGDILVTAP